MDHHIVVEEPCDGAQAQRLIVIVRAERGVNRLQVG
jgi:hypothetical protein